jgi:hypothetical protein
MFNQMLGLSDSFAQLKNKKSRQRGTIFISAEKEGLAALIP